MICNSKKKYDTLILDPDQPYCLVDQNLLRKAVEFFQDKKEIEDDEFMRLIGIYSKKEIMNILDVYDDNEYIASLNQLKTSNPLLYDRITHGPNKLCTTLGDIIPCNLPPMFREYVPVQVIGAGLAGIVVQYKKINDTDTFIGKFVKLQGTLLDVDEESRIQKMMYNIDKLAPEILGVYQLDSKFALITMKPVHTTLHHFLECIIDTYGDDDNELNNWLIKIIVRVIILLKKLKVINFTHGDMHTNNIGVNFGDKIDDFYLSLIDFGQSSCRVYNTKLDASQFLRSIKQEKVRKLFRDSINSEFNINVKGNLEESSELHRAYRKFQIGCLTSDVKKT